MHGIRIVGTMVAVTLVGAGSVAGVYVAGNAPVAPDRLATTWSYPHNEFVDRSGDGNLDALADEADVGTLGEDVENGTCDAVDFNGERFAATPGGTPIGVCCCDDFGDCMTAPGTCPSQWTQTDCPCATAACLNVG